MTRIAQTTLTLPDVLEDDTLDFDYLGTPVDPFFPTKKTHEHSQAYLLNNALEQVSTHQASYEASLAKLNASYDKVQHFESPSFFEHLTHMGQQLASTLFPSLFDPLINPLFIENKQHVAKEQLDNKLLEITQVLELPLRENTQISEIKQAANSHMATLNQDIENTQLQLDNYQQQYQSQALWNFSKSADYRQTQADLDAKQLMLTHLQEMLNQVDELIAYNQACQELAQVFNEFAQSSYAVEVSKMEYEMAMNQEIARLTAITHGENDVMASTSITPVFLPPTIGEDIFNPVIVVEHI